VLFRLKAFLAHLSISVLLLSLIAGLVVVYVFPSPFFHFSGGVGLLKILVPVDIILGPALTFIVAKQGKKELKRDFFVIGAIQVAALAYGIFVTYGARPVYLTFTIDRFELVSAHEVSRNADYEASG
jgi:hypothetical protein